MAHDRTPDAQVLRRVVIESPFAATAEHTVDDHVQYARRCVRDTLHRGEAPIASHLLHTQPGILDDDILEERALGMEAGWAWIAAADAVIVYEDMGISPGMQRGIERAERAGVPVERRRIR
ncbi:hypothetical protein Bequi_09860 [Brachybacterium sp. JHP9]|uniref:DUF7768 domain-containing protein n=1 Tax=Brachybacterium equifaecis TaxID=2910770 RepID=A0ABT0R178_9MICO|nr:hypothetical protein [Brachybacterium equifaecis]MCL6423688.1 hypothetical protein [Brachybacterium equifaecis]